MGLRIDRGGGGRRDVIRSGQPAPAPTAPVAPAQRAQVPPVRPEGAIALQAALGALQGVQGVLEETQRQQQARALSRAKLVGVTQSLEGDDLALIAEAGTQLAQAQEVAFLAELDRQIEEGFDQAEREANGDTTAFDRDAAEVSAQALARVPAGVQQQVQNVLTRRGGAHRLAVEGVALARQQAAVSQALADNKARILDEALTEAAVGNDVTTQQADYIGILAGEVAQQHGVEPEQKRQFFERGLQAFNDAVQDQRIQHLYDLADIEGPKAVAAFIESIDNGTLAPDMSVERREAAIRRATSFASQRNTLRSRIREELNRASVNQNEALFQGAVRLHLAGTPLTGQGILGLVAQGMDDSKVAFLERLPEIQFPDATDQAVYANAVFDIETGGIRSVEEIFALAVDGVNQDDIEGLLTRFTGRGIFAQPKFQDTDRALRRLFDIDANIIQRAKAGDTFGDETARRQVERWRLASSELQARIEDGENIDLVFQDIVVREAVIRSAKIDELFKQVHSSVRPADTSLNAIRAAKAELLRQQNAGTLGRDVSMQKEIFNLVLLERLSGQQKPK